MIFMTPVRFGGYELTPDSRLGSQIDQLNLVQLDGTIDQRRSSLVHLIVALQGYAGSPLRPFLCHRARDRGARCGWARRCTAVDSSDDDDPRGFIICRCLRGSSVLGGSHAAVGADDQDLRRAQGAVAQP
jgi:hypothetical protein